MLPDINKHGLAAGHRRAISVSIQFDFLFGIRKYAKKRAELEWDAGAVGAIALSALSFKT
jgi:hypothetical protein